MSIFSYMRSSWLCIITTHSPSAVSHTSARLLMPVHHLCTSSGGGSVSAGLTQAGKRNLRRGGAGGGAGFGTGGGGGGQEAAAGKWAGQWAVWQLRSLLRGQPAAAAARWRRWETLRTSCPPRTRGTGPGRRP
jgi:hypothetical protein